MALSVLSCNIIHRKMDEEQEKKIYIENDIYLFCCKIFMLDTVTDLVNNNFCIVSVQQQSYMTLIEIIRTKTCFEKQYQPKTFTKIEQK